MPEADALEAEFVADVNEVIGLQQTDDITTQGPLYTVEPWGVFLVCVNRLFFPMTHRILLKKNGIFSKLKLNFLLYILEARKKRGFALVASKYALIPPQKSLFFS